MYSPAINRILVSHQVLRTLVRPAIMHSVSLVLLSYCHISTYTTDQQLVLDIYTDRLVSRSHENKASTACTDKYCKVYKCILESDCYIHLFTCTLWYHVHSAANLEWS